MSKLWLLNFINFLIYVWDVKGRVLDYFSFFFFAENKIVKIVD